MGLSSVHSDPCPVSHPRSARVTPHPHRHAGTLVGGMDRPAHGTLDHFSSRARDRAAGVGGEKGGEEKESANEGPGQVACMAPCGFASCGLPPAVRHLSRWQMAGRLVKGSPSFPGGLGCNSDALAYETRPSVHVVPLGGLWPWVHPHREAFT